MRRPGGRFGEEEVRRTVETGRRTRERVQGRGGGEEEGLCGGGGSAEDLRLHACAVLARPVAEVGKHRCVHPARTDNAKRLERGDRCFPLIESALDPAPEPSNLLAKPLAPLHPLDYLAGKAGGDVNEESARHVGRLTRPLRALPGRAAAGWVVKARLCVCGLGRTLNHHVLNACLRPGLRSAPSALIIVPCRDLRSSARRRHCANGCLRRQHASERMSSAVRFHSRNLRRARFLKCAGMCVVRFCQTVSARRFLRSFMPKARWNCEARPGSGVGDEREREGSSGRAASERRRRRAAGSGGQRRRAAGGGGERW